MRKPMAPRPTLYKGIKMRSRLEAAWAEQFDAWDWKWAYEPDCFAGPGGQYLPDFRIDSPFPRPLYVEVKPAFWMEPEHWGFKGDSNDIANWNESWDKLGAQLKTWESTIRSSQPDIAGFAVFCGANEDGEAWIFLHTTNTPNEYFYDLVPMLSLVLRHDSGCGFTNWHLKHPTRKADTIDHLLRGSDAWRA